MPQDPEPGELRPEVAWGLGCFVGGVAMIGILVLVFFLAFVANFPQWIQIVLGVGLSVGGAALAWLVASALAHSRGKPTDRGAGEA